MFQNDCMECEKKSSLIDEKQKEILFLHQNIFEIKSKMIDTNSLMNSWMTYKKENDNLKKELNLVKSNKNVSSEEQSLLRYNFELLQNKYDQISKQYDLEKYKNAQFSAACDDIIGSKELRVEIVKLKKQISEKDKEISELLKIKSTFEKQRKIECAQIKKVSLNEQIEKEEFLQKCQDEENRKGKEAIINHDYHLHSNIELNSKKLKEMNILPDFSFKELIDENEYLKTKYQKYNSKYIKFKAKYSETKSFIEILLQRNIVSEKPRNEIENRSKSLINFVKVDREISFDLLQNKRKPRCSIESCESSENSEDKNKKKRDNLKNLQIEKKMKEKEKKIFEDSEELVVKEKPKKQKKVKKTDFEKKLEKVTAEKKKMRTRKSLADSTSNAIMEIVEKRDISIDMLNKSK